MRIKSGLDMIKTYMRIYGLRYGMKINVVLAFSHIIGRRCFFVKNEKLGDCRFWMRSQTGDIIIAKALLEKNGEYDFLFEEPYREVIGRAKVIIDAGANIGMFSRICENINNDAHIYSIELESENYKILAKNVEGFSTITAIHAGLWNRLTTLTVSGESTLGYNAKESLNSSANGNIQAITVPYIMKLYNIHYIDVFKIDIEGAEYEVFDKDAEYWIDFVRCFIIEFHERYKRGCEARVFEMMEKHDFSYRVYGENVVFIKM